MLWAYGQRQLFMARVALGDGGPEPFAENWLNPF